MPKGHSTCLINSARSSPFHTEARKGLKICLWCYRQLEKLHYQGQKKTGTSPKYCIQGMSLFKSHWEYLRLYFSVYEWLFFFQIKKWERQELINSLGIPDTAQSNFLFIDSYFLFEPEFNFRVISKFQVIRFLYQSSWR